MKPWAYAESEHRGYIQHKDMNQPTGRHFNSRGHKLSDMCATILEKVYSNDDLLRGKGIYVDQKTQ